MTNFREGLEQVVHRLLGCSSAAAVLAARDTERWKDTEMAELSRLPGPVMDLWEWQYQGACREADPNLFFHPEGERGGTRRRRDEAAKAICATCPVIQQCREHALKVREPYGVWGGLSEDDRQAILSRPLRRAS
jgi:WhiB family transcriptional regulator, redox-sensing transcriptional regulator